MTISFTPVKTQGGVLLGLTSQASGVITLGGAVDVSGMLAAKVMVKYGRIVATALTNEINFRLEVAASANNDEWYPISQWTSTTGKTASNSTTLNGATTAGNTTSTLTSGTGWVAGDYGYFRETGTPANSEWSRVKSVSGAVLTFEEGQTRNHTNSIAVTRLAEQFNFDVDTSGAKRMRLVVDTATAAAGQTIEAIGWINSLDSILGT